MASRKRVTDQIPIPPPEPPRWRRISKRTIRSYKHKHYKRIRKLAALRPTPGNEVILIDNGDSAYDSILRTIRDARNNINISTYIFESDYVGKIFKDVLIQKVKEGVEVNVIYDAIGSIRASRKFFKEMKEAGVNLIEFHPIFTLNLIKLNQRLHRKLFIIDGKVAYIGGMNISCEYAGPKYKGYNWRDVMAKVEGPAVADLQTMFFALWIREGGTFKHRELEYFPQLHHVGNKDVVTVGTDYWVERKQLRDTFLMLVRKAEREIFIESAYFLPDHDIRRALREAARRGVDVRIIIPRNTDVKTVYYARRAMYKKFLKAGVKIYEYTPHVLHTKMAIIDRSTVIIGSANFDYRGFLHNIEGNIFVEGGEIGRDASAIFKKDQENSLEVILEEFEKRSIIIKFVEWFLFFFRYLL